MSPTPRAPGRTSARAPLHSSVLVVGPESAALREIAGLVDGLQEMDLLGVVSCLSDAVDAAERDPPSAVLVVTEGEGGRLWRAVMELARPPLHLPVVLVGPQSVRTTGFLIGAEDWLPIESVNADLICRTVENAVIRRRIAGGLPTQGHLHGLVTGMAHEVNNPLTVIIADLEEVCERLEEQRSACEQPDALEELDELCEMLSDDLVAAHRIKTLARSLQELARLADTVPAALHTGPALRRVMNRVQLRFPQRPAPVVVGQVEMLVHAAVLGFEEALYQVTINAMQAHIDAAVRRPVCVEVASPVDGVVEFRVRDSGDGIPADLINKVLSPFKSGRPPGQGLGLGLTLATLALRRAGGELTVRQPDGGGTEVVLAFLSARETLSPLLGIELDDELDGIAAR